MQNLKFLLVAFLFVLLIFNTALGEKQRERNLSLSFPSTQPEDEGLPNIFRLINNIFKKPFKKRSKPFIEGKLFVVSSVSLSPAEITASCSINEAYVSQPSHGKRQTVTVTAYAARREEDKLVYQYEVTAGKIIGEGEKVIWDLSNVKPGTYTISVSVNDGDCGVCSSPYIKEIRVIECS